MPPQEPYGKNGLKMSEHTVDSREESWSCRACQSVQAVTGPSSLGGILAPEYLLWSQT